MVLGGQLVGMGAWPLVAAGPPGRDNAEGDCTMEAGWKGPTEDMLEACQKY